MTNIEIGNDLVLTTFNSVLRTFMHIASTKLSSYIVILLVVNYLVAAH